MKIIIQNTSDLPIYEQIKEQIKEAILSGELNEGDMLPPIRQVAADTKVSVVTTNRAYSELEAEGFITNMQGKGCYVAPKDSALIREQLLRKVEDGFSAAIVAARLAKLSREELLEVFDFLLEENANG